MPFDYLQPLLGLSFVVAWAFIGGLMMRDTLDETRRHRIDYREKEFGTGGPHIR